MIKPKSYRAPLRSGEAAVPQPHPFCYLCIMATSSEQYVCICVLNCKLYIYKIHHFSIIISTYCTYSAKVWRGKTLTNGARTKLWWAKLWWIDCSLHRKSITGKRLEGNTLMNCSPFVKFVRHFHRQSFALYSVFSYTIIHALCSE